MIIHRVLTVPVENRFFTADSGARLCQLLNDGWRIINTESTKGVVVYVLRKET